MRLIRDVSTAKRRGGYYTPPEVAQFLLDWGLSGLVAPDILEPSCGNGVFIQQLKTSDKRFSSFLGIEYNKQDARKAASIDLEGAKVMEGDFHEFCLTTNKKFDLAIGNPPFIRYQYYEEKFQEKASKIFCKAGMRFSKLTNAWVTFIVGCTLLLNNTGKMAFVVPAELLQVAYAKQLRQFLSSHFNKICIVSFRKLVFADIQQNVVLLLCEKDGSSEHVISYTDVDDIESLSIEEFQQSSRYKRINPESDKWTYYFLSENEIAFLESLLESESPRIKDFANIEVGITTGANQYFTVSQTVVDTFELHTYAKPMVGRSVQVRSLNFTKSDWKENRENGARANILIFDDAESLTKNLKALKYIEYGKNNGIDKGFKTSIRDKWYVLPSIKKSHALFVRRNHLYPKLILNSADAYTTDTMHRVFIHKKINKKAFVACYYNSFSFAQAEIVGRNFGGGALELMPSEAGSIFLPYHPQFESLFNEIDIMLRQDTPIEQILDMTDRAILIEHLGYTPDEVRLGRTVWRKLSERRRKRYDKT